MRYINLHLPLPYHTIKGVMYIANNFTERFVFEKADLLLYCYTGVMLPIFEPSYEGSDSKQTCVGSFLSVI